MAHSNDSSFPIIPATEVDRRRASITKGQQHTVATSLAHQDSPSTRFTATDDRIRPATCAPKRKLKCEPSQAKADPVTGHGGLNLLSRPAETPCVAAKA